MMARVLSAAIEGVVHAVARGEITDASTARLEVLALTRGYLKSRATNDLARA